MIPNEVQTALESMVDSHGLSNVLYALADIAGEKGAHIRASYADDVTARTWNRAESRIRTAGNAIADLQL